MDRRRFLKMAAAAGAGVVLPSGLPGIAHASNTGALVKSIPSSGERIPVLGMGSWITFNVGNDAVARAVRVEVLRAFIAAGGGVVDSSPMYGSSEDVIGYCLSKLPESDRVFSATKVWTRTRRLGIMQMEASARLWRRSSFDLMQVHNLVDWQTHLETLGDWKDSGRIRYIGVTTSHGRRHNRLVEIMNSRPLDFVQFTYNIEDREAEQRLLPLAAERGMAVIINRPFQRGALIDRLKSKPLPDFATEIGCRTWPQYLLKFIISHPAVTCAIPATSDPAHMRENMIAARGPMPDPHMRRRMADYVQTI